MATTHAPDATTSNNLFVATYTRDPASRITVKQEIRPSGTTTWAYNYDAAGRLVNVTKNGDQYAAYTYDQNGNRTSKTVENQTTYATFDNRDRMNTHGDLDLTYNQNGELTEKRDRQSTQSLHLAYTASGDLKTATTQDGRQITYLLDAAGRRVGKKIDGALTQGLIYSPEAPGPVTELDAQGDTKARFIYATGHAPAYMVKDGATYRVITDQLGSVVMVVNAQTGAIAQEISYDPYGEVLADSNPGFQPFGFAGGMYDTDTGLTHFGAREYDAELGRWSSSDPIGFGGGDTNLHGYVLGDPVNFVDPSGLYGVGDLWGDVKGTVGEFDDTIKSGEAAEYLGNEVIGFTNTVTFGISNRLLGINGECVGPGYGLGSILGLAVPIGGGTSAAGKLIGRKYGAKVGLHEPHHFFPGKGLRPHFQVNWWKKGEKGSGGVWRLPLPRQFPIRRNRSINVLSN